jgi:hypothetical protein
MPDFKPESPDPTPIIQEFAAPCDQTRLITAPIALVDTLPRPAAGESLSARRLRR